MSETSEERAHRIRQDVVDMLSSGPLPPHRADRPQRMTMMRAAYEMFGVEPLPPGANQRSLKDLFKP